MINLANSFAERGILFDFIVIEASGPFIKDLSKKVKLVSLLSQSFCNQYLSKFRIWKLLKYTVTVRRLTKYLRKNNIHILLSTLALPNILSLIVKKYLFKDMKLIVRIANTHSKEMERDKKLDALRAALLGQIFTGLLPTADAIITNSQGSGRDIKTHIPTVSRLVQVIYNPVVSSQIALCAAESVSHPWIDKQDYRIILAAHRLRPQKDTATLIRAFAKIFKVNPSSRLIILGDGIEKSRLKSLALQLKVDDVIDFIGHTSNPFAWMAKAHVFVLSSLFEGCPNALIEAMACGTPVVSTDCPNGPREILQEGKLGKLVPVGNHRKLAQAILATLDNPTPSHLLQARVKHFSVASSTQSYSDLFKSLSPK